MEFKNINIKEMLGALSENADAIQENLSKMDGLYRERTVTAAAGGDLVIIELNLKYEVNKLILSPTLLAETPEVVAELIQSAMNQAVSQVEVGVRTAMMEVAQGIPPKG